MRLTMLNTNVLVKPLKEEEGKIIVEKNPNDYIRGEVQEVGDGYISDQMRVPMKVRPSSIVWFEPQDARPFKVNDETWYIIRQDNILVVEEDK